MIFKMYIGLVERKFDKEETDMSKKQQQLNQYLERAQYVDEYYREYVKRLNKRIAKVINC